MRYCNGQISTSKKTDEGGDEKQLINNSGLIARCVHQCGLQYLLWCGQLRVLVYVRGKNGGDSPLYTPGWNHLKLLHT